MSNNLRAAYTRKVHKVLSMYAGFPPGESYSLGDYGWKRGDYFERIGNIEEKFKVQVVSRSGPNLGNTGYQSNDVQLTEFDAKAGAALPDGTGAAEVQAGVQLSFAKQHGFCIQAKDAHWSSIDNSAEISREIIRLSEDGSWNDEWCLVSSLLKTGSSSVFVSQASQGVTTVGATALAGRVFNLADASLGLKVVSNKAACIYALAKEEVVPVFFLSKLQPRHRVWRLTWGGEDVKQVLLTTDQATPGSDDEIPLDLFGERTGILRDESAPEGASFEDLYQLVEVD